MTTHVADELRVGRIDLPSPSLLCLEVRRRGHTATLVVGPRADRIDVGFVATRPRGAPANAFVMALRKRLTNGTLTAHRVAADQVVLRVSSGDEAFALQCAVDRDRLRCTLRARSGVVIATLGPPLGLDATESSESPIRLDEPVNDRGSDVVDASASATRAARIVSLTTRARRHLKRLERREQAVHADLERVSDAVALQARANLLLPMLGRVAKGARSVDTTDWSADPPTTVRITLDPATPLREQIDAMFRRASRLLRGEGTARARLSATRQAREALQRWLDVWLRHDPASDETDIDAAEAEAQALGVPRAGSPSPRVEARTLPPARRVPFRTFTDEHGREIRVGKGAASNDALTLHHSKPWDVWLHARGVPGAHVIVPLARGTECPAELLVDAATLAVHFSDARAESVVEVTYVARRFVRKPRGSAAGAVSFERERVIAVRMDDSRRRRLLASERV